MNEKEPVALLINDIHVNKDNIPEFDKNWAEAYNLCRERNIPEMIIGGDLWHSRSAQSLGVLMAVYRAISYFTDHGIKLTIAEGNHCKVDQEAFVGYSHLFGGMPNVAIVDDFEVRTYGDVVLWVTSYFPENGLYPKLLKNISNELRSDKFNILYAHEGIRGGIGVPSDDELPAELFSKFDKVLVGHYHNRKKMPGTNIEYIGASRQHNFGEDEEKGYTILFDDGSHEFVKNQANMRYMVIDVELADMDEAFFSQMEAIKNEGRYKVKVRINCSTKEAATVDKQKYLDHGVTKLEFVTEQTAIQLTESQDLSKKYDKPGIKQEYISFCSDKAVSNVEMGLHYLDKIN